MFSAHALNNYANQKRQTITRKEVARSTVGEHILAQHSFLRDFFKFVILCEILCTRLMIVKQMSLKIICSDDTEDADHRQIKEIVGRVMSAVRVTRLYQIRL